MRIAVGHATLGHRFQEDFRDIFLAHDVFALAYHFAGANQNSVTLDPDVKDAWGLPATRITFNYHPNDLATMTWVREKQFEILNAAGAKKVWALPYAVTDNMPSRHLMGTYRMGKEPASSVVNAFSRANDVPNLFIADGSNMVTSGRQQPTATIQALAYRSADFAIQAAKRGELGLEITHA